MAIKLGKRSSSELESMKAEYKARLNEVIEEQKRRANLFCTTLGSRLISDLDEELPEDLEEAKRKVDEIVSVYKAHRQEQVTGTEEEASAKSDSNTLTKEEQEELLAQLSDESAGNV